MKAKQLHHTSIRVKDLDCSRKFYEEILSLHQIDRPNLGVAGVWYGIGGGQLHLIANEPMGMKIDPSGPHFAIEVENLDDARRQLAARGVEVLDPGGDQLWFLDPDGYTIELTRVPSLGNR